MIYTPGSLLRRIWIPKPGTDNTDDPNDPDDTENPDYTDDTENPDYTDDTDEKRPLSIPTIKDKCLQALFKMAIEPEWKIRTFSYKGREGKGMAFVKAVHVTTQYQRFVDIYSRDTSTY